MESIYFEQPLEAARGLSLVELLETFFRYNKVDAKDAYGIRKAFDLLFEMFAGIFPNRPLPDTADFKPGYLVKYQYFLAEKNKYSKSEIERKFGFVKRVFKWGGRPFYDLLTCDKVPAVVSAVLLTDINAIELIDLSNCRENNERLDVPREVVEAVYPHVPPYIADMLRIQLLTSMRPSEVCDMRVGAIKRTREDFARYSRLFDGENWIYVLDEHKTVDHIGKKVVAIALEAQDVLNQYLAGKTAAAPVFSKVRTRGFGKPFTVEEYDRYVKRAIDKHGLPKFVPYQVRHTGITRISLEYDRDTARAVAGHTTEAMTARYDHSDPEKVLSVAREQNRLYRERRAVGGGYGGYSPAADVPTFRIFSGE